VRIIPVIDLKGGQVVRAVAGQRQAYLPVKSVLASDSAPRSIARAFVQQLGATDVYVADLDAISGRKPSWDALGEISHEGLRLLLDAGIKAIQSNASIPTSHRQSVNADRTILGLESLASPVELESIVVEMGAECLVFSLDLFGGQPMTPTKAWSGMEPLTIAAYAIGLGISSIVVLDLQNVGTGNGTTTENLCSQIKQQHAHVDLITGGGVRDFSDIERLCRVGCSAVLVSSAIHDGSLTAEMCRRLVSA